ncbi:MAG: RHS repeat protein, partial [Actinobacteria bacterium]|nr:RHS repeat protein [Actinomycetota bacterium]
MSYEYDADGNRTQMTDGTGDTTYTHDELGRVITATSPGSKVVGYRYDLDGNRTRVIYPDSTAVDYTFDKGSRLTSLEDWSSRTTSYDYLPTGSLETITNTNGTTASYTYDNAQRLTRVENYHGNTILGYHGYTLDSAGNRTRASEVVARVGAEPAVVDTTYGYDRLYRLTDVDRTTSPIVPLGYQSTNGVQDYNAAGMAEAFVYTATRSATIDHLWIYLDQSSTASQVVVGLYDNAEGDHPGTLLVQGTITSPTAGAWNSTTVAPTEIAQGQTYWIAVLGPVGAGTVYF